MRLVHVALPSMRVPSHRGGANEKIVAELANQQGRYHDTHVISVAGGSSVGTVVIGRVTYHYLPWPTFAPEVRYYWRAFQLARTLRADLIQLHESALVALFSKVTHGPRVVSYVNFPKLHVASTGAFSWLALRALSFPAVRCLRRVIACSQVSRSLVARRYGLVAQDIDVIWPGVDTKRFQPDESRREEFRRGHGITPESVALLFVGRICEQKGVHLLVEAVAILHAVGVTLQLLIAGPASSSFDSGGQVSPYARGVLSRLAKLGGTYLGQVTEDEVADAMRAADLLVLPTLDLEMFGMVLLEALASGTPVVASDAGAIPEVLASCPDAALFRTGDARALAAAIMNAVSSRRSRTDVRAFALNHDWTIKASSFDSVYETLMRRS